MVKGLQEQLKEQKDDYPKLTEERIREILYDVFKQPREEVPHVVFQKYCHHQDRLLTFDSQNPVPCIQCLYDMGIKNDLVEQAAKLAWSWINNKKKKHKRIRRKKGRNRH